MTARERGSERRSVSDDAAARLDSEKKREGRTTRNRNERRERVRRRRTLGLGDLAQERRLADRGEAYEDGAAVARLGDIEALAGLAALGGAALEELGAVAGELRADRWSRKGQLADPRREKG